jgi:hypothetical protein
MIERYPVDNPYYESTGDVPSTLNMNLATRTTRLAAVALCELAGLID